MTMNREEEILDAALDYANNLDDVQIKDDFSKLLATSLGQAYIKGAEWADSHPSLEVIEKVIKLTFDSLGSTEDLNDLAQLIKEKLKENYNDIP